MADVAELERFAVWLKDHEGTLDDYREWVVDAAPVGHGGAA